MELAGSLQDWSHLVFLLVTTRSGPFTIRDALSMVMRRKEEEMYMLLFQRSGERRSGDLPAQHLLVALVLSQSEEAGPAGPQVREGTVLRVF